MNELKKELDNNDIELSSIFNPLVEILVDEALENYEKMPCLHVPLKFGLMLRLGDILFFDDCRDEDEIKKPKWVVEWENEDQLFDWCIEITCRNIFPDRIAFYAKRI
jgi:hypothetical protein